MEGIAEVGRPPGIRPGTDLDLPVAFNFPPLPLLPGKGYTWQVSIDGAATPAWTESFFVRPANGMPQAA
jgi:hypothetical protein